MKKGYKNLQNDIHIYEIYTVINVVISFYEARKIKSIAFKAKESRQMYVKYYVICPIKQLQNIK